jgi:hypothetical protein
MPACPEALASTITVLDNVDPADGAVMTIDGGATVLTTVTAITLQVVVLPLASRAMADRVCVPSTAVVVFHNVEYGPAVSSTPSGAPSRRN